MSLWFFFIRIRFDWKKKHKILEVNFFDTRILKEWSHHESVQPLPPRVCCLVKTLFEIYWQVWLHPSNLLKRLTKEMSKEHCFFSRNDEQRQMHTTTEHCTSPSARGFMKSCTFCCSTEPKSIQCWRPRWLNWDAWNCWNCFWNITEAPSTIGRFPRQRAADIFTSCSIFSISQRLIKSFSAFF